MSSAYHCRWTLNVYLFLLTSFHGGSIGYADSLSDLPPLPSLRRGPTLTLEQAIRQADKMNRSLSASRVDIELAASKLKAAWAQIIPTLYGNLNYTLNDHADTAEINGQRIETKSQHELSARLEARMPLVNAQLWKRIDAAHVESDLSDLNLEQMRQQLLYTVAEAYFQAATLQRLIAVYTSQAEALRCHLEAAKARYTSGVGVLVDIKRAQTDLIGVREEQIKAVYSLEDTRDALALLVASAQPPLPIDTPVIISIPEGIETRAREKAFSLRWDLQIAHKSVLLADKLYSAEWMQFIPTLSASWQYGFAITEPDTLRDSDRSRWFAGLILTVPFFDYNFYPNLQKSRAALKQARIVLEEQKSVAEREYIQTKRMVAQAQDLVATAEMRAKLANDTLELSQVDYLSGEGSALTVIDAQRSNQIAQVDLETRRFELELAKVVYLRAIGRDVFEMLKQQAK